MTNNTPDYLDHDIPNLGYLIVCSGYQTLVSQEAEEGEPTFYSFDTNDYSNEVTAKDGHLQEMSVDEKFMTDKLGRLHYKRLISGPVSSCFKQRNSKDH